LNSLDYFRISFIDVSERRLANPQERKALSAIQAALARDQPVLAEALRADTPPL
jgi:hypothetical protein